mmetsp:Transcript_10806/g.24447  ORF Transcript_10806/g.24447 Transcript_10806/m.24447 type:complete len:150 (+) Transcript_10806:102-551(+)
MAATEGAVIKAIEAEGELLKRREAQLDERLSVLERLAASIAYPQSTGVSPERRLPPQMQPHGYGSADSRDFSAAYIDQPLMGYYVDRSKIHKREVQVNQQFAVGQEHQLIYGVAGISREGATKSRWLKAIEAHHGVEDREAERNDFLPF